VVTPRTLVDKLQRAGITKPALQWEKTHTYPASKPEYVARTPHDLFDGFQLPESRNIWAYIHVPFCNYNCGFCFYAKLIAKEGSARQKALVERYLETLPREMDFGLRKLGLRTFSVKDLYVGGGTPMALDERQLAKFLEILATRFEFQTDALATIEASPESLTAAKIEMLRSAGFSRFSLGIQSAERQFLDVSGRKHTVEDAFAAYDLLREHDVDHINVDLIYGFPGETPKMWEASLRRVMERIEPESLTLYYLRYVPGTPFTRRIEVEERTAWEVTVEMRQRYMRYLEECGYEMCRPHFYRKPEDRIRRYHGAPTLDHHNYGTQIGFGPSAYSHLGYQVGRSASTLDDWIQKVEDVGFGTVEGRELTLRDRVIRRMMQDLCNMGVLKKTRFAKEFGTSPEKFFGEEIRTLISLGLVENTVDELKLTPSGILVDEEIAHWIQK